MSKPCPFWFVVLVTTVLALALALVFVSGRGSLHQVRRDVLASAATQHAGSSDLLVRFSEALVSRADQTMSLAQLFLTLLFLGAGAAALKAHLTARELREEYERARGRLERLEEKYESRFARMQEEGSEALWRMKATANEATQRNRQFGLTA